MMNNQYANYVLQHLFTIVNDQQREKICSVISPHIFNLRTSKYGQRVANLVERFMQKRYV